MNLGGFALLGAWGKASPPLTNAASSIEQWRIQGLEVGWARLGNESPQWVQGAESWWGLGVKAQKPEIHSQSELLILKLTNRTYIDKIILLTSAIHPHPQEF